jgi:hypothetical protein
MAEPCFAWGAIRVLQPVGGRIGERLVVGGRHVMLKACLRHDVEDVGDVQIVGAGMRPIDDARCSVPAEPGKSESCAPARRSRRRA